MPAYRVFIGVEIVRELKAYPRKQQVLITQFLDFLGDNPHHQGDYIEHDNVSRPIQVAILGRFAVFYWADHAVEEVKIVDLKLADT
jgi:mRNA-degrading endonuclease RelE of RelBE toxin-antitoxin system